MAGSYDFEEQERLAELKAWWEDNRIYVVLAVIAAILTFAGWQAWQWWGVRAAEDAALLYKPVAEAAKGRDPKKIADAAGPLIAKHPRSFYASESALIAAKAAFDAGNLDEARKQLEWALDKGVEEHRGVARTRLASVLLEQKKYEDALKVLDGNKEAAFAASVADLRGDVMLAQGRIDEARAAYKLAIDKAEGRSPVRSIAETKLNALGGAQ
ncbi:MAG: tetratricopeptide repeat protein [Pseudomonadota bacterium]|nr:tetratricopeptide repeat protein [Pseudomonadota bacterium]